MYTKIQPTILGIFFFSNFVTNGSNNQAINKPINIGETTRNISPIVDNIFHCVFAYDNYYHLDNNPFYYYYDY